MPLINTTIDKSSVGLDIVFISVQTTCHFLESKILSLSCIYFHASSRAQPVKVAPYSFGKSGALEVQKKSF